MNNPPESSKRTRLVELQEKRGQMVCPWDLCKVHSSAGSQASYLYVSRQPFQEQRKEGCPTPWERSPEETFIPGPLLGNESSPRGTPQAPKQTYFQGPSEGPPQPSGGGSPLQAYLLPDVGREPRGAGPTGPPRPPGMPSMPAGLPGAWQAGPLPRAACSASSLGQVGELRDKPRGESRSQSHPGPSS